MNSPNSHLVSNEPIISVRDVKRVFRSIKKAEGLKGSLQLLYKPQYSEHQALKGFSFDIKAGEFVGLIGANGAGKTTLLKILAGLIPPSSGTATVLGEKPFDRSLSFRKKIALVMGQKAQLWWDLPAVDAFDLLRAIYAIDQTVYRERLNTLAKLLDVTRLLNTQIRRLSLGERMKMELIGAILHWPSIIFLDEPTIGLDVLAAHNLREFLRTFNERERATIILTSHNMDDIEQLCPRILIIRNGELIYDGDPKTLTNRGQCVLKVRLMEKPTNEELAAVCSLNLSQISRPNGGKVPGADLPEGTTDGAAHVEKDDDDEFSEMAAAQELIYFNIERTQVAHILQPLLAKYRLIDMGIDEQTLESVIQRIYEQSPQTAVGASS